MNNNHPQHLVIHIRLDSRFAMSSIVFSLVPFPVEPPFAIFTKPSDATLFGRGPFHRMFVPATLPHL